MSVMPIRPVYSSPLRLRARCAFALLSVSLALVACGGGDDEAVASTELSMSTHELPSRAKAARTPGSPNVAAPTGKLAVQFGSTPVDLNRVRYTRFALKANAGKPVDAVLVAVPGTLAAANSYLVLAENLVNRMWTDHKRVVEVWGVDRRSVLLQDMGGLQTAERERDPRLALNFLFGNELALSTDPRLPRRAVFHESTEIPFLGDWTPQVHSFDIDAVVERALAVARDRNVFLGGHSAGTNFVGRYASTDFNLTGTGAPEPGYAKLRGLVLFEGIAGSLVATPPTGPQLDAVIAAADGGLYAAVAAGTEQAFVARPGISPRTSASTEITGLQIAVENTINGTQSLLQADQGGTVGNNVYMKLSDFTPRAYGVTAGAGVSTFMDDDNTPRTVFYSISMGFLGDARNDGLRVWLDNTDALPAAAFRDFGAAPATVSLATPAWGKEVEPTNLKRFSRALFVGDSTYSDWYYPSSGLLLGNASGSGGANLGLDTSPLSLPIAQGGRGRADIVNQTQARNINVPVIAFGGSNGLTPVPGLWRGFAEAIAPCAAPSCTANTPRTPAGQSTLAAARTYGGVAGGFEVYISEGYTHVDVLTANDDSTNNVVRPLSAFIQRNVR
jgi:hypothetical protein